MLRDLGKSGGEESFMTFCLRGDRFSANKRGR